MKAWQGMAVAGGGLLAILWLARRGEPSQWTKPPPGRQTGLPPVMLSSDAAVLAHRSLIMSQGVKSGIEAAIIAAIISAESGGDATRTRWEANVEDYSYGLMQIRWTTAKWLGYGGSRDGLLKPSDNISYGVKYLKYQYDRYGDLVDAIAAYNSGTVRRSGSGYANQSYVDRVTSRIERFRDLLRWYYPGYDSVFPLTEGY